jgi:hypothetical protein
VSGHGDGGGVVTVPLRFPPPDADDPDPALEPEPALDPEPAPDPEGISPLP